mgnify:CR=1 FL=1
MEHEEFRATNRVFEEEVVGRGDFGALERVYTRDARVLPPGAPTVMGLPAIADSWRGAAEALGVQGVRLRTVSLDVLGDRAQEVGRKEWSQGVHGRVSEKCGDDGADTAQAAHRTQQGHVPLLVAKTPGVEGDGEQRGSHDGEDKNDGIHVLGC